MAAGASAFLPSLQYAFQTEVLRLNPITAIIVVRERIPAGRGHHRQLSGRTRQSGSNHSLLMDSEVQIKQIVLKRMERCTVCHREFDTGDIHVISRKPDIWTMLVECTDCHSRNFVAAVLNDGDPKEAQLALRRLSEQAIKEIRDPEDHEPQIVSEAPATGEKVDAGDVIDMHDFLADFDGDFKTLFR
jgi:hypothetical protein